MHNDDDQLAFVEDVLEPDTGPALETCWSVLIVDDDEDVHHATEFALHDLRVWGRPLHFLHAFSAAESIISPSRMSMARRTLPSRLELNRPFGSASAAPLAKVSFTTAL